MGTIIESSEDSMKLMGIGFSGPLRSDSLDEVSRESCAVSV